jgi:ribonucleoside-diphosphate reductase alpha chain
VAHGGGWRGIGSAAALSYPARMSEAGEQAQPQKEPGMVSQRKTLPAVRDSVTHKFSIMGHEGYLTIGLFEDGQPGEIFIKMAKEGSTLSGLVQGYCRAFSLALQYGLPMEEAVRRFKGMRFEPLGTTSNPEIPEAASIIDYLARYLELHFSEPTRMR